jgi:6,7-dimethyl-8-ribityllumazine synthase
MSAAVPQYAIVTARYNAFVTARLADAARAALMANGVAARAIHMLEAPGAWELPMVAAPPPPAAGASGRWSPAAP